MQHRFLGLALLIVLSSLSAAAAPVASNSGVYPGSKLNFELMLTEKDFLPALKQFVPMIPGVGQVDAACAQIASEQFAKDLSEAIAGLKSVSVKGYILNGGDEEKLIQFYAQKVGLSVGWTQTMRVSDPRGSIRLYVKPELTAMFGLVYTGQQIVIIRTDGKIDVERLAKIAAQLIPMAMHAEQTAPAAPPATTPAPVQAAPAPPAPPEAK